MSSYSEYLGRQKQRVTKYLDTRPHRDAGHQTEIVKRLAASAVQDSKTPNRMGNNVLDGPSTRVNSYYAKAHTVQDAAVYNEYTAGQAVAQTEKPENQKPPQIEVTCCSPPEINDRMITDPQFALIYNARQGVRRNCCYNCGKVYDAAVCGCINRVPGGGGGCDYMNLQGMYIEPLDPITEGNSDDGGFYLSFGFPFYFNNVDYGSIGQVYFTTNQVIGFGDSINAALYDPPEDSLPWNTDYQAILFGWFDRLTNSFYSGPYVETRGDLQYHQILLFGQNYYNETTPNTVEYRIIFGRDEIAGYQYIEFQFQKVPTEVGIWDMSYDGELTGMFGDFAPQACTTLLLRSQLDGMGWEVLRNQTLGVPPITPPPTWGSLFFDRGFAPGPAPSSAWLSIPQTEGEFSPGTRDFSVEWWQKWYDDSYDNQYPFVFNLGVDKLGAYWEDAASGNRQFRLLVGGTEDYPIGDPIPINGVWIHVSVARIGDTIYLWLDGVLHGSVSDTTDILTSDPLVIGQNSTSPGEGSSGYEGYITNFRFIVSSSAYGPGCCATDPFDQNHLVPKTPLSSILPNTQLLLLAKGAGIAFDDALGHVVTNYGCTWDPATPFTI